MRVELINSVAARVENFRVLRPKGYEYDTARHRDIFEKLTQGVQYVFNNAVEGDIAEFGTASGFTARIIARAMPFYQEMYAKFLQQHGVGPKLLYLFDSFQGLPPPDSPVDQASPNVTSGRWKQGTFHALNQEELLALCASAYDRDKIRIVEGWYSESLKRISPGTKFAMLHVDCDLYSSTADVLDYVFGKGHVADGACIFFDDWNCNRSSPRFGQRRAWREAVDKYKIEYSDCGDYGVISHKFIVHMNE